MSKMRYSNGSVWRKWDLHLHTPETKLANGFKSNGDAWIEYIDALENSDVHAFGITDYFSCDNFFKLSQKYRERHPDSQKALFLNIEFRLSEAISVEGDSPDLHVIFDNDPDISNEQKILKFLSHLRTHGTDDNDAVISCADLKQASQFSSATVSINDVREALKKTFGTHEPYILVFPAKNNGVKSTDTKSPRKVLISDQIDKNVTHFLEAVPRPHTFYLKDDTKMVIHSLNPFSPAVMHIHS